MTQPLRQIDDHADVLADPDAHWPYRPAWLCIACGQPWPCEPLRTTLLATQPAQDIGVAMADRYQFAVLELPAAPGEVHQRLFGWIRG